MLTVVAAQPCPIIHPGVDLPLRRSDDLVANQEPTGAWPSPIYCGPPRESRLLVRAMSGAGDFSLDRTCSVTGIFQLIYRILTYY